MLKIFCLVLVLLGGFHLCLHLVKHALSLLLVILDLVYEVTIVAKLTRLFALFVFELLTHQTVHVDLVFLSDLLLQIFDK